MSPIPRPIAIGAMRLSTDPERDDERSNAVLHAALDAGVDFIDTADAYGLDERDIGHNERLVARALATWSAAADRPRPTVATKGGLTRPEGRWVPDGRARHLTAACEASLVALGVSKIDLYQLHLPDPRTPLATSVRALAALQRAGLVHRVGLCNVTVAQIEEARRSVDVASVQVELSAFDDAAVRAGIVEYCAVRGILLLAHRPLGGVRARERLARDETLATVASRRIATPAEVAIAWLRSLGPTVVPLPGPTSTETARSSARAAALELDGDDRARLDARSSAVAARRAGPRAATEPAAQVQVDGEVVILMGYPAAGKSTAVHDFVSRGYHRLNRDEKGGKLVALSMALDRALAEGHRRFVLDNTYPSRKSRNPLVDVATRHGVPVRCVHLDTSLEQAQVNACERLVARYGKLPMPEELAALARGDPNAFAPNAQFRYRRELEPPDPSEGFASVERRPFERRSDPTRTRRALLVDLDGVLWSSRRGARTPVDAGDVVVDRERGAALARARDEGWLVLGLTWQPGLADGTTTPAALDASLARAHELLGVRFEIAHCPHAAGPPICWCRKPLPGLGVALIAKHGIDASASLHVGRTPHDRLFAERLGLRYRDHAEHFARD